MLRARHRRGQTAPVECTATSSASHANGLLERSHALFTELDTIDQVCGFRPEFMFGALANDMKRVQDMIQEHAADICKLGEQECNQNQSFDIPSPDVLFTTIDSLNQNAQGSQSSATREAFTVALKSFEATLLKVSDDMLHLDTATLPPGTIPSEPEGQGPIAPEHIAVIRSSLQQLCETEASRSLGNEAAAFANLLEFRLKSALAILTRGKRLPVSRDRDAAWCHRALQGLQRRDVPGRGSSKPRLSRWACEPRLVHQSVRQLVKPWLLHKLASTTPSKHRTQAALFRRVPSVPAERSSPADRLALSAAAAEAWVSCVDRSEFSRRLPKEVCGMPQSDLVA